MALRVVCNSLCAPALAAHHTPHWEGWKCSRAASCLLHALTMPQAGHQQPHAAQENQQHEGDHHP